MAFPAEILERGVGIASKLLDGVKVPITFQPWIHDDGAGADTYGGPFTVRGFVNRTNYIARTGDGRLISVVLALTFVDVGVFPITTATGDRVRSNPIDPRDIFTLADGSTAPIMDFSGTLDPKTGKPFAIKVLLGYHKKSQ